MVLDIGQTYCCQKNLFLFSALPIILDIKIARAKVGEIKVGRYQMKKEKRKKEKNLEIIIFDSLESANPNICNEMERI